MKLRPLTLMWWLSLAAALLVPVVMLAVTAFRVHLSERWYMVLFFVQLIAVSLLVLATHRRTRSVDWSPFR